MRLLRSAAIGACVALVCILIIVAADALFSGDGGDSTEKAPSAAHPAPQVEDANIYGTCNNPYSCVPNGGEQAVNDACPEGVASVEDPTDSLDVWVTCKSGVAVVVGVYR